MSIFEFIEVLNFVFTILNIGYSIGANLQKRK